MITRDLKSIARKITTNQTKARKALTSKHKKAHATAKLDFRRKTEVRVHKLSHVRTRDPSPPLKPPSQRVGRDGTELRRTARTRAAP